MSEDLNPGDLQLLIVDDDDAIRTDMLHYFKRCGYRVTSCPNGAQALQAAETTAFDVAVIDMAMPAMSGLELLKEFKKHSFECEVIVLTGEGSIESAVQAMKCGAHDYLTKPIRLQELDASIKRAFQAAQLKRENVRLKAALSQHAKRSPKMIGRSECMQEVFRLIERVGKTDKPVLIQGESGVGKELVARGLHDASPLADNPLVVINCAALPETLLESELFGHEKGAFTGAVAAKPGLFEVADGGTLFIDEIGELAGSLQAKLLRVLEDGSLRRVGSVKERHVKVRLIAATNRDLESEVKAGRFREDLYYRINVLTIRIPPLRERIGDIPLLAKHFLGANWQIDDDFIPALEQYPWPGNVRQLQNALERAKILAVEQRIQIENLPPEVRTSMRKTTPQCTAAAVGFTDLETLNKTHILDVYKRHGGNKARTARALGVGRRSLYRMLEKYGIHEPVTE